MFEMGQCTSWKSVKYQRFKVGAMLGYWDLYAWRLHDGPNGTACVVGGS